ncbi:MAG: hypothetical protein GWM98_28210 [Nitrospinaceae bacterium]|nr:lipid-binding SYLF domain-containing protein [Nitrospinaceae bacterium]NIR57626.1 lipid-binding SYLF domain-containing protein [Nitrospinaceae bacterium]NIS88100.1 lipid-binding SYLF domain-containing protein [Nitrospinaceae bacterium]NIT84964.1 lipid-binding SYLF domain-containing protein [Nitrospinaceae bacterium]NIU47136.1 lipid-binding SYLF domain-containing protein [Nitrospinaceae bacterium]
MKYLSSLLAVLWLIPLTANAEISRQKELLIDAQHAVKEIMSTPDLEIPTALITKAKAIIIFPSLYKGGFFVGASYGTGIVCLRDIKTGKWGPPSFITTAGGSFGFQFGFQAVDRVLVVMSERGLKALLKHNFTLGGDVSVTAGPVGRNAEIGLDVLLQGDMYSYSRSQGIFGGVSLKGTLFKTHFNYNKAFYQQDLTAQEILKGKKIHTLPESSRRFINYLNKMAPPPGKGKIQLSYKKTPHAVEKPKVLAKNATAAARRTVAPQAVPKTKKPETPQPAW